jgi:hypothetical protein
MRWLLALLAVTAVMLAAPVAGAGLDTSAILPTGLTYDEPDEIDQRAAGVSGAVAQRVDSGEGTASRAPQGARHISSSVRSLVAPSAARGGLNSAGGLIEQTGTNAAGGRIFTSTGKITQRDFAGIVNSALYRGDDVHIFTGAHGLPNGSLVTDATLLADDVAAFGRVPGVQIHDLPSMSPAQVREILESPGTIIGGFCDSGACLAPFGG